VAEIRRAGIVIDFGTLGDGPPVLLLPGRGGAGTDQYGYLANELAGAGFRAVALSPRGTGGSSGPLEDLSLHDYAADVAAVIETLGEAAHVVGRAFGNRVARCTAADHPALVKSVSVVAAGGLIARDPSARPRQRVVLQRPIKIWQKAGRAHEQAARATPLDDWWSGGSAPMLVVQGLDDHIAVPANGRALARDYPERVRLVEIADAGHFVLFEQPALVCAAIVAFIRDVEQACLRDH
jgi:pimeloyl-ACP methyl ester carboxylesterase